MSQERRQFSRIAFDTEARLSHAGGELAVQLLDISLKGALLQAAGLSALTHGTPVTLRMPLGQDDAEIRMEGTVAHQAGEQIGLVCTAIDLDSITHLRRLVELNLGDETLLEREWHHLVAE